MTGEAQLIRHGVYNIDSGLLTDEGRAQAENARDVLTARDIGERVIILSSDAIRAAETSQIIAAGLRAILVLSPRVRRAGEFPDAVGNLGEFLKKSLQADAESTIDPEGSSFVVVTHAPLVAKVIGNPVPSKVIHGEVHTVPLGWTNPHYRSDEDAEFYLSGGLER